jgi:hypothetical protein
MNVLPTRDAKMQGAPKKTSGRSLFSGAPRCAPLRLSLS